MIKHQANQRGREIFHQHRQESEWATREYAKRSPERMTREYASERRRSPERGSRRSQERLPPQGDYDRSRAYERKDSAQSGYRRDEHPPALPHSVANPVVAAPAPPSAAMQPGYCKFSVCYSPMCQQKHLEGQWKPDRAKMALAGMFTRMDRCRSFHDGEQCTFRGCQRIHGKSNNSAALCEKVGSDMCDAFYSAGGCLKSHKRA